MNKATHLFGILLILTLRAVGASAANVDGDLKVFDDTVSKMKADFAQLPADPKEKKWVNADLAHMVEVDQYMRNAAMNWPKDKGYSEEETKDFWSQFGKKWAKIDGDNTSEVKGLLKIYDWFRISSFGSQGDDNGWLLVQHADHDPKFQQAVLEVLGKLYPKGESLPAHFAYLWDRVCASWQDISKQKPQRFGTQGTCVAPGKWEPIPIEDPANVDARRKEMGIGTLAEYIEKFKEVCK